MSGECAHVWFLVCVLCVAWIYQSRENLAEKGADSCVLWRALCWVVNGSRTFGSCVRVAWRISPCMDNHSRQKLCLQARYTQKSCCLTTAHAYVSVPFPFFGNLAPAAAAAGEHDDQGEDHSHGPTIESMYQTNQSTNQPTKPPCPPPPPMLLSEIHKLPSFLMSARAPPVPTCTHTCARTHKYLSHLPSFFQLCP